LPATVEVKFLGPFLNLLLLNCDISEAAFFFFFFLSLSFSFFWGGGTRLLFWLSILQRSVTGMMLCGFSVIAARSSFFCFVFYCAERDAPLLCV
jgi:hypothetical protein